MRTTSRVPPTLRDSGAPHCWSPPSGAKAPGVKMRRPPCAVRRCAVHMTTLRLRGMPPADPWYSAASITARAGSTRCCSSGRCKKSPAMRGFGRACRAAADGLRLVAGAAGVVLDLDQFSATRAPGIAIGKDQAAYALVEHLHAARVIAEVERDPAFAGFVAVLAVGDAIHDLLHGLGVHADGELREF